MYSLYFSTSPDVDGASRAFSTAGTGRALPPSGQEEQFAGGEVAAELAVQPHGVTGQVLVVRVEEGGGLGRGTGARHPSLHGRRQGGLGRRVVGPVAVGVPAVDGIGVADLPQRTATLADTDQTARGDLGAQPVEVVPLGRPHRGVGHRVGHVVTRRAAAGERIAVLVDEAGPPREGEDPGRRVLQPRVEHDSEPGGPGGGYLGVDLGHVGGREHPPGPLHGAPPDLDGHRADAGRGLRRVSWARWPRAARGRGPPDRWRPTGHRGPRPACPRSRRPPGRP